MYKPALYALLVLMTGMIVLSHYWPDFRKGLEYLLYGECHE